MAQSPPKIPNMSTSWQDFSSYQKIPSHASFGTNNTNYQLHLNNNNNNNSSNSNDNSNNNNPSWVDEFLDFSSARRGAHRRVVSDSITFLDAPPMAMRQENNDNNEFDKFDDEQFMSMFNDEIYEVNVPPTLSSSNPSSPSDQNFNNDEEKTKKVVEEEKKHVGEEEKQQQNEMKNEPDEVESECIQEFTTPPNNTNNTIKTSSNDRITDPKRVKRILANRQSAQRSRVRKLQYTSELERSVTSLQAEVSLLSPRVAFLDHQRLLLTVDNSALKQRIAALGQDKIFKDAHQEALKREIERLRQVYHQQNLKNMENAAGSQSPSPKSRFDAQTEKEQLQLLNV
ncbi:hypothetical protein Lal_00001017 [Lupinus albus]|uniref:Putative transcription factor bZIP family n=1 Tax=Lupinus albus TaxID=3870 RepID=A0A6A4NI37_LUPAL|nr:putative transcription factor bZIP family [Lupinus albus]KAF1859186.1 hypothetical protein Lal_00001017 [Lupinus albus]